MTNPEARDTFGSIDYDLGAETQGIVVTVEALAEIRQMAGAAAPGQWIEIQLATGVPCWLQAGRIRRYTISTPESRELTRQFMKMSDEEDPREDRF